jgi:hypothetical protein
MSLHGEFHKGSSIRSALPLKDVHLFYERTMLRGLRVLSGVTCNNVSVVGNDTVVSSEGLGDWNVVIIPERNYPF